MSPGVRVTLERAGNVPQIGAAEVAGVQDPVELGPQRSVRKHPHEVREEAIRKAEALAGAMSEIGAFEAKTHLPKLLKRVQQGERFVTTRHNQPVAELIPFRQRDTARIRAAIDGLKEFQRAHSLGGLSVRQMIEEGRRY